ncbi:MAG: DUF4838 domain-containing protein [Kiritimatiellia bacterium]
MNPVVKTAVFFALLSFTDPLAVRAEAEVIGNDLNPVTFHAAPEHDPVVLVKDGVPLGYICVMTELNGPLKTVVDELQETVRKTTGAELPVIIGTIKKPGIVIGDCPEAEKSGLTGGAMPIEGFGIKTAEGLVFIVGNDEPVDDRITSTGSAWGVVEFMERFVGVRWYWRKEFGGRSLLETPDLVVEPVHLTDAPAFRKREFWPPSSESLIDGQNRSMRHYFAMMRNADTWPISVRVHEPQNVWEPYRKDRPEIFALREDGTRHSSMYCYSEPKTLQTFLEEIEAHYGGEELPTFRRGGATFIQGEAITVSPPDVPPSCFCDRCRELWNPEGGRYGAASYILGDFVRRLSAEVKERWPDKTIIYLPYQNYTEAPEGIEFSGNVEVQICGMPGIAQYKEPEIAAWEQEQLEKWFAITGRKIQNWHYSVWPADRIRAPYQYPNVLADYYRKNREILVGTFINGGKDLMPRHHLSLYVWSKVLWDPDFNVDAGIREYVERMYGPAAEEMGEIVRILVDGWEQSRWPNATLTPSNVYTYSYPPEKVERIQDLLAAAGENVRDDPEAAGRLDYFTTPFKAFFREFTIIATGEGTRPFSIHLAAEKPVIDGKLDDAVWRQAEPFTFMLHEAPQGEKEPEFETEVRALWTMDSLIVGFRMEEPETHALVNNIGARNDSMMWHQDCIELFLDASGKNSGQFHQIIITAAGTIWDAAPGGREGRGAGDANAWNMQEMEVGVHIADGFWSVEVSMPFEAFNEAVIPRPGTPGSWHGQITRHRHRGGKNIGGAENQKLNAFFGGFNSNTGDFAPFRFFE